MCVILMNIISKLIDYCVMKSDNLSADQRRKVKGFVEVWVSTTLIMWFYVAFSFIVFDFSTVGLLGIIYSVFHTLTPVIYRYTSSLTLAGLNISLTAIFFQITFCIFNGGIHSPSAIWFTAHPVIISFFASRSLILFSVILNMIVVTALTLLGNYGYFPIDSLTSELTQTMMISSLIGLDIVIATYTLVFISKSRASERELSERNELIENLLRIIGHDISNALQVSTLSSRSLEKYIDNEKARGKLDQIHKSNQKITEIANSVKQWMKTNDSTIALKQENISFFEIEKYISECFEDALNAKNQSLRIMHNVDSGLSVIGDSNALRNQVIGNLILNAIKFSDKGSEIIVKCNVVTEFLELSVIDKGIGIPENLLNTIFDPSRNASRKGTEGENGTGFGMPIVKALIEGMNGSINIESSENIGTTISIRIPMA